jgi:hypothetical protein
LEWLAILSSPSIFVSGTIWLEWSGRIYGIGKSKGSLSFPSSSGKNFFLYVSVVPVKNGLDLSVHLHGIDGCGFDSSGDKTQRAWFCTLSILQECMAAAAGKISVTYSMAGLM